MLFLYCFGRCSSELVELVSLPYFGGRSGSLHDFSVTICRFFKETNEIFSEILLFLRHE